MLNQGDRHDSYRETGKATYSIVAAFFDKNLRTSLYEYNYRYWSCFLIFFDAKTADSQFLFKDAQGDRHGMYSWANPGYSRLRALEHSAKTLEKKYIEKKGLVLKTILLDLFSAVEMECHNFLEEGRRKIYEHLRKAILDLKRNYLTQKDAKALLKDFLSISCLQVSIAPSRVGLEATDLLNEDHFILLKDLIDPEKEVLTYEDVKAFAKF